MLQQTEGNLFGESVRRLWELIRRHRQDLEMGQEMGLEMDPDTEPEAWDGAWKKRSN
jgi:hypothetical protein